MADEVMDTEMSERVMGVVTMIVMTLITMVRYSRILARHDNPSLYPSLFRFFLSSFHSLFYIDIHLKRFPETIRPVTLRENSSLSP